MNLEDFAKQEGMISSQMQSSSSRRQPTPQSAQSSTQMPSSSSQQPQSASSSGQQPSALSPEMQETWNKSVIDFIMGYRQLARDYGPGYDKHPYVQQALELFGSAADVLTGASILATPFTGGLSGAAGVTLKELPASLRVLLAAGSPGKTMGQAAGRTLVENSALKAAGTTRPDLAAKIARNTGEALIQKSEMNLSNPAVAETYLKAMEDAARATELLSMAKQIPEGAKVGARIGSGFTALGGAIGDRAIINQASPTLKEYLKQTKAKADSADTANKAKKAILNKTVNPYKNFGVAP